MRRVAGLATTATPAPAERLPRDAVDEAVLHQLVATYRDRAIVGDAVRAEQAPQRCHDAFEQGHALLRLPIDELRVNGRAEILPAYRLVTPEVCAMSEIEVSGRN